MKRSEQKRIICACGCGREFDYLADDGRPRRFIHGHNGGGIKTRFKGGLIPWNKGKKGWNLGQVPWNKGLTGIKTNSKGGIPPNKRNDLRERKEEIIRLYKEELLNPEEVAKIFKCGITPIHTILRDNHEFMSRSKRRKVLVQSGRLKTWNKGLTKEIDSRVKLSCENLERWREKNYTGKTYEEIYGIERTKEVKAKRKKSIVNWWEENKNSEIAKRRKQNLSDTIKRLFKEGKRKAPIGENHPNWLGGISFEPYTIEFSKTLKQKIRERDDYTCQECGKTEWELSFEKSNYGKSLRIHHIDYDKKNNTKFNLISLCNSCHTKTNYNRKHWKDYFQMKMFIRELFNPQNIVVYEKDNLINTKQNERAQ